MNAPAKPSSITSQTVRGAGWTIATGVTARALGLIGTLALTYFLAPDVQGEVSDAYIVVLTVNMLTTLGVLHFIVARPQEATREIAWHITVFHLSLGVLALGGVVLARNVFGAHLNAPTMGRYVPGFAIAIFLERVALIVERIHARNMSFRVIGIGRTFGEIAYALTSVGLAFLSFGGMSIVWGNIARGVVYLAMLLPTCDRRDWLEPHKLRPSVMKPVFKFGLPLAVGAWASFISRRWDNLLISAMFGAGVAGEYNLAYNLADIPAIQVGEQIGEVLLPSFAKMDPALRIDALIRSTGLLSLVIFPLAVGLGAIAPTLVPALLNSQWASVTPMLMILSALSVTRPFGFTIAAYLQASNLPRAAMWLNVSKVVMVLASISLLGLAGTAWGDARHAPLWACVGVGIGFGGQALASMFVVARRDGLKIGQFLWRCAPPLVACVPMALAVWGTKLGMDALSGVRLVSLLAQIIVGGIVYVLSALVFARTATRDLLGLVREAVRSRRAGGRDSDPPPPPEPGSILARAAEVDAEAAAEIAAEEIP